jgi:hypothetical protein
MRKYKKRMGEVAAERHVQALERRLKEHLASCGCISKLMVLVVGYEERAMLFVELRELECIAVARVKMRLKTSMRWLVRVHDPQVLIAAVSLGVFGLVVWCGGCGCEWSGWRGWRSCAAGCLAAYILSPRNQCFAVILYKCIKEPFHLPLLNKVLIMNSDMIHLSHFNGRSSLLPRAAEA